MLKDKKIVKGKKKAVKEEKEKKKPAAEEYSYYTTEDEPEVTPAPKVDDGKRKKTMPKLVAKKQKAKPPTPPTSSSEPKDDEGEEEGLLTDDFPPEGEESTSTSPSQESEVFEAESAVPKRAVVQAKRRPNNLPDPKQKPPKRLADDKAEMDRLREESRKLEQAQREVEAERAQLRAELRAKKAKKKAEEAAKQAEEIKKAAKEKEKEEKKELRRQAELELRKEGEARVADLRKGQTGAPAEFCPKDPAERKKFIKESNQQVADYQAKLKRVHKEEQAKEKAKEDRRPEVDRILKASGGYEKAQEIRAQLERMKKEGSWKQRYSDRKAVALPPEIPNATPGERLAWQRAIPTDIDPWSRPFSFWDRPWKQVCADSLSGGVYSCGSQACRSKSFGSETAFWQHLVAKSHTRGHPDKAMVKQWEAEAAQGVEYTPLLVDPNWISGLAEIEQQTKLKESMRLRLKTSSDAEEDEAGEESSSTNDTQVSVAQHSEVVVSEAKYVRDLTTYKAPTGEEAPAASEPKDAEDPKKEEGKTAEEGFPAEDQKDAVQKNEDHEKRDVADPEDKTAKVEDPEAEVPKPAESKPVEVSTEPSVKESGVAVAPTEVPVPPAPIDSMPSVVETPAEAPSASVPPAEVSAAASTISGVHEGGDIQFRIQIWKSVRDVMALEWLRSR